MSDPLELAGDATLDRLTRISDMSPALVTYLRTLTPSRIGLRRSGSSLATGEILDFQLAHAQARDAVHAALDVAGLVSELKTLAPVRYGAVDVPLDFLSLRSNASDRRTYLQRPDLGRTLNQASLDRLAVYASQQAVDVKNGYDVCFVIADGLSALAVERHAKPLLAELFGLLKSYAPDIHLAPICLVEQGRVAVGDEVARALSASMVVVLIGERPGLSSPDSLGAYITWLSDGDVTDADRNCISNIRAEGLSYAQAAARLFYYVREGRRAQLTGVTLKDPEEFVATLGSGEITPTNKKDEVL